MTSALLIDKHVEFIKAQDKNQDEMEFWLTQHLRTSGVYWGLVGLELMNREDALDRDQVVEYILECQNPDGGYRMMPPDSCERSICGASWPGGSAPSRLAL
ncbi:Rab geranylgeranyltransferase [Spiromyces aspiralis]|uniref:Rab geranylgeranyltransferase n=1 Tax=Spiromyces aspiralis TaxID=68401 RepID=A0ACC1HPG7_9FUNG|nr:Rab geranylgeranyltransferase [Spiromyces aspiralis]